MREDSLEEKVKPRKTDYEVHDLGIITFHFKSKPWIINVSFS